MCSCEFYHFIFFPEMYPFLLDFKLPENLLPKFLFVISATCRLFNLAQLVFCLSASCFLFCGSVFWLSPLLIFSKTLLKVHYHSVVIFVLLLPYGFGSILCFSSIFI